MGDHAAVTSRSAVVYSLLALAAAAVFVPMSLLRIVDADEGAYLLVSRLVVEGRVLYHDFFYPQMYLLPYLYGAWMLLFGYSWYAARLLSAVFCIGLTLLVCRQVTLLTGSRAWGIGGALLLVASGFVFGWYPLVKAYAPVTLLMFGAYSVLSTRFRWRWAASGLLLGLAVACRVYVVGILPAFLFELYLTEREGRARLTQLARFTAAFALALLPAAWLFAIDSETFMFNIVGNQILRDQAFPMPETGSWWAQKTRPALALFGLLGTTTATARQFLFLVLPCLAAWIACARARRPLPLASLIALCLFAASHVPTPVYGQYFCMLVPFLLVDAVVFIANVVREDATSRARHLVAVAIVAYVLMSPADVYRFTVSAELIEGHEHPGDWRIPTIRAVGHAVDRHLRLEHPFAVTFWPGYFVETRAAMLPGMENHFALYYANHLSPRQVAQFRLMSGTSLMSHLSRGDVDVVAVGNRTPNRDALRDQLLQNRFVVTETIGRTEIFTRPR
jgi:4-amino-4-deoxy-L-arabinose transferase-like glycosyltransferase